MPTYTANFTLFFGEKIFKKTCTWNGTFPQIGGEVTLFKGKNYGRFSPKVMQVVTSLHGDLDEIYLNGGGKIQPSAHHAKDNKDIADEHIEEILRGLQENGWIEFEK